MIAYFCFFLFEQIAVNNKKDGIIIIKIFHKCPWNLQGTISDYNRFMEKGSCIQLNFSEKNQRIYFNLKTIVILFIKQGNVSNFKKR